MRLGDHDQDTIMAKELESIVQLAGEDLPAHRADLRGGAGGTAWVVLEPLDEGGDDPRFTICRIAPSLVVMIESDGGRRFVSASTVEAVMDAVRAAADDARSRRLLH